MINKRVVWLYHRDHTEHPFILLALTTLRAAHYRVLVVDGAYTSSHPEHTPINRYYQPIIRFKPFRAILWILRKFIKNIDRQVEDIFKIIMFLCTLIHRPHIILVTAPRSLPVAKRAAKLLRARLVYYSFELYAEKFAINLQNQQVVRQLERDYLPAVDALITQNQERARYYQEKVGVLVKPVIVHNYKRFTKIVPTGKLYQLLKLAADTQIVLYEGSLVEGRSLVELVQAAPYLPENARLVFIGKKTAWWQEQIEPLLQTPAIAAKVMVSGWIPHEELFEYVADARVGVMIYDKQSLNNYYCEPGKLSDYVIAGVPVVMPNYPTIAPVIEQYQIGATFDELSPQAIAQSINEVLAVPRDQWQPALEKARQHLIWETQEPCFLKAVEGDANVS